MSVQEILKLQGKLATSVNEWKEIQRKILGRAAEIFPTTDSSDSIDKPESWRIILPSSFMTKQRLELGLVGLANKEIKLQKGSLFDSIQLVCTSVKALSVLRGEKNKNACTTSARTRATMKVNNSESKLHVQIKVYNRSREALLALSPERSQAFPEMFEDDTYRTTPSHLCREIGASRMPGARPWNYGVSGGSQVLTWPYEDDSSVLFPSVRTKGASIKSS